MNLLGEGDVIFAPATPQGRGPLSIIRVSGKSSEAVVRQIASFLPERLESHRVYYGWLKAPTTHELVDEVLLSYFEQGRSYTGENSFEISCHGNPTIVKNILMLLKERGARTARPGEFTFRAFMNGRISLAEAESVQSLIQADSPKAIQMLHRHLEGDLRIKLNDLRSQLYGLLAQIEAGIDFSTEGLELWPTELLVSKCDSMLLELEKLIKTFDRGKRYLEGVRIALVGAPNVGKSSLMNVLAGESVSIVHGSAGTTRDLIRTSIEVNGIQVSLVDTAGLRESSDEIENMGIQRTRDVLQGVEHVFACFSAADPSTLEILMEERLRNPGPKWHLLGNKSDLVTPSELSSLQSKIKNTDGGNVLFLSAIKANQARDQLLEFLERDIVGHEEQEHSTVLCHQRHRELLVESQRGLDSARKTLYQGIGHEFASVDLTSAAQNIDQILGIQIDEAVIDRIFKDFCLGK